LLQSRPVQPEVFHGFPTCPALVDGHTSAKKIWSTSQRRSKNVGQVWRPGPGKITKMAWKKMKE
jgi:hypothetical protein